MEKLRARPFGCQRPGKSCPKNGTDFHLFGPNAMTDEFVIMPNHVHGIIVLKEAPVEKRLRGVSTREDVPRATLGTVMRQFKSRSTTRIRADGYRDFAWQTRFHDRIIRGDRAVAAMREYIANNPAKWALDSENPANFR